MAQFHSNAPVSHDIEQCIQHQCLQHWNIKLLHLSTHCAWISVTSWMYTISSHMKTRLTMIISIISLCNTCRGFAFCLNIARLHCSYKASTLTVKNQMCMSSHSKPGFHSSNWPEGGCEWCSRSCNNQAVWGTWKTEPGTPRPKH